MFVNSPLGSESKQDNSSFYQKERKNWRNVRPVHYFQVLHFLTKWCFSYRYKPYPEDQLTKAFEVLDVDKKGHLTVDELTKFMTEEGMLIFSLKLERLYERP